MDIPKEDDANALRERVQEFRRHEWRPGDWGRRLTRDSTYSWMVDEESLRAGANIYPVTGIQSIDIRAGLVWSRVTVRHKDGTISVLGGLRNRTAREFVTVLNSTCVLAAITRLRNLVSQAERQEERWKNLESAPRWLAQSEVRTFIAGCPGNKPDSDVSRFLGTDIAAAARSYLSYEEQHVLRFLTGGDVLFDSESRNDRFLEAEKVRYARYFDRVEKNPLTEEQREAVITFDDNVMTVAAAGSGKTSVMVAKAGYAVESGQYKPEEILLLAFNRDAAKELAERVAERLGPRIEGADRIVVGTFHALGLAIIGKATGKKPSVAPWLQGGDEIIELGDIVSTLSKDAKFAVQWNLFKAVYATSLPEFGDKEEPEWWDPETGTTGFRTYRGETVKSQEERMIANWLALNGVDYRYERKYAVDTATEQHSNYHPDFWYPSADLYHEHFGVDKNGNPPSYFEPGYKEGMKWKRQLHDEQGTYLIETTSHSIRQRDGFDKLEADLRRYDVQFGEKYFSDLEQESLPEDATVLSVFRTFMSHVKSNRLTMSDLSERAVSRKSSHPERDWLFLQVFEKIWDEWDRRLRKGNYVDFDDMLCLAVDHLATDKCRMPYRLIMADEFQDSSRVRGALLKELSKDDDARLFVVGDDWQAVNRFAGADISLMRDFGKYFGNSTVTHLTTTFRCPSDLCEIAGTFIAKNPFQIEKTVHSKNPKSSPSVLCFKMGEGVNQESLLRSHVTQLAKTLRASGETATAYVLGRYRSDCLLGLSRMQADVQDVVDLKWSTIHRAKGLEADYIFLLNVIEATKGLPSKIADDSTLWIAMPDGEDYPHAEERRLFYVALTRAKKMVSIYTDFRRRSEFIAELERDGAPIEIRLEGDAPKVLKHCPKCQHGVLNERHGRYGPFLGCSRFPRCDHIEKAMDVPPCPECGKGTMVLRKGKYGGFLGCSRYPNCKHTEQHKSGKKRPNRVRRRK